MKSWVGGGGVFDILNFQDSWNMSKMDVPIVVACPGWTPIFELYVDWCGSKKKHPKGSIHDWGTTFGCLTV